MLLVVLCWTFLLAFALIAFPLAIRAGPRKRPANRLMNRVRVNFRRRQQRDRKSLPALGLLQQDLMIYSAPSAFSLASGGVAA